MQEMTKHTDKLIEEETDWRVDVQPKSAEHSKTNLKTVIPSATSRYDVGVVEEKVQKGGKEATY